MKFDTYKPRLMGSVLSAGANIDGLYVDPVAASDCTDDTCTIEIPSARTCRTCGELGWAVQPGSEVCAESDGGVGEINYNLISGIECTSEATWAEAYAVCRSAGTRLCTAVELERGEGQGTGCGHNSRMVWSQSSVLGELHCRNTLVAVTVYPTAVSRCLAPGATAAVRCCADVRCPDSHKIWNVRRDGTIRPQGNPGFCMNVYGGGLQDGADIALWTCSADHNEVWQTSPTAQGRLTLTSELCGE
jgi:hypothetical protein